MSSPVYFACGTTQMPAVLSPRLRIETLDGQTGARFRPIVIGFAMTQVDTSGVDSDLFFSLGLATVGRQFSYGMFHDTGLTTTAVYRRGVSSSVAQGLENTEVLGEVAVHEIHPDGFSLQWMKIVGPDSFFKNVLVTWWAIGGDGVDNADLSLHAQPSSPSQVFYDLGYSPDAVILLGKSGAWDASPANATVSHCLGMIGGGSQAYSSTYHGTGVSPSVNKRRQRTDNCFGLASSGGVSSEASWVRNDRTGITLNWTAVDGSEFLLLAIRGPQCAVVASDGRTSNGTRTVTAGFSPAGLLASSFGAASTTSTVAHARRSFGAASASASGWAAGYSDNDAVNPTVSQHSIRTDRIFIALSDGAGAGFETALTSVDSSGVTVTDSNTDATARQQLFLFFGQPRSSSPPSAFDSFAEATEKEVVVIAEADPALHAQGWTVDGTYTNCYKYTVSRLAHTDVVPGGVYRRVVGVRVDTSDYTEVATTTLCNATPRSWYWDEATGEVYVYTSTGADPDTFTAVQVLVRFYFGTKGLVLNRVDGSTDTGVYYHPRLTNSLPNVSSVIEDMLFGNKDTSSGSVSFTNGDGLWNTLIANYLWRNKSIRFYVGGSYGSVDLLRSEYQPFTSMIVRDISATEVSAELTLAPVQRLTDVEIPPTPIFESEFPRLGEGVRGTRKWVGWGRSTIRPDLVDTNGVWLFTDPAFMTASAVHNVYLVTKSGNERILLATTAYTVDLGTGTLTISGVDLEAYDVEMDLSGPVDDAGLLIDTPAAVAKDMLKRFAGLVEQDFDSGQFRACDEDWDAKVSVWLKEPRSVASLLATSETDQPSLERSAFLRVYQTLSGEWTASLYDPSYRTSGLVSLRKQDISEWRALPRVEEAICGARVHFNRDLFSGEWDVVEVESLEQRYLQDTRDKLDIHTFLVDSWRAELIGRRAAAILYSNPLVFEFAERGSLLAASQAGEKILVTFSPAPTKDGALSDTIVELVRLTKSSLLAVSGELFLSGFGDRIGLVAPAALSTLDYSAATDTERKSYGWVSDANGDIVVGDATTRNKSIVY